MDHTSDPDQRWVCPACGKHTELGGSRYDIGDTSCVLWAILCEAEPGPNGLWVPVSKARKSDERELGTD